MSEQPDQPDQPRTFVLDPGEYMAKATYLAHLMSSKAEQLSGERLSGDPLLAEVYEAGVYIGITAGLQALMDLVQGNNDISRFEQALDRASRWRSA